jgi:hypothetical protein
VQIVPHCGALQRVIFVLWGGETAPQNKNNSLQSAAGTEESAKFARGVN